MWNKAGFTLLEGVFVLFIIAFSMVLFMPIRFQQHAKENFELQYVQTQLHAMATQERMTLMINDDEIVFLENGNVQGPKRIVVNHKQYLIGLGGGRLVEKGGLVND